jgi:2-C-methyl-D-erythritol 4-phosphate cytidylyltransferase
VLVVGDHTRGTAEDLVAEGDWQKVSAIVTGGARRQDSVMGGFAEISPDSEIVAIHDGARPLVAADLFDECIVAAYKTGAAIAAVQVSDTLKRVASGKIVESVPREHIWAAQTPQAFRVELIRKALEYASSEGIVVTDEASILEQMGVPVGVVQSSPANLKITHQDDLWIAEALFAHLPGRLPEVEF